MYDSDLREQIDQFADYLEKYLEQARAELPSNDYEVVLDIEEVEGIILWKYYYVDHDTRTLFWLRDHDAEDASREIYGLASPDHVAHYIRCEYWFVVQLNWLSRIFNIFLRNHWSMYTCGMRSLPVGVPKFISRNLVSGSGNSIYR